MVNYRPQACIKYHISYFQEKLQNLKNKRFLVGITGGIAAYKSPEIVRLIIKAGGQVKVVITEAGKKFVTPCTLETVSGNRVHTELFPPEGNYDPIHIGLARWGDAVLIAPATANLIGKAAAGIADDLLTTILLAVDVPVFMAPAMNPSMYHHPALKRNLEILHSRGIRLLEPDFGPLASTSEGVGVGRLPEPARIVEWLNDEMDESAKELVGLKVLITAGPTIEEIDPVRFISNHSSGKMGFAIAEEAARLGAEVVLIHGAVPLTPPLGVETVRVKSAEEMMNAVKQEFPQCDIAIMSAAVADFKPLAKSVEKIKKKERLTLEFVKTPDILKWMGQNRGEHFLVGFALEDKEMIEAARRKLVEKKANLIVLNSPDALHSDDSKATFVTAAYVEELPLMSKRKLARRLLKRIISEIR